MGQRSLQWIEAVRSRENRFQLAALLFLTAAFGVHATYMGAFAKFAAALPGCLCAVGIAWFFSYDTDTKGKAILFIPALLVIVGLSVQSIAAFYMNRSYSSATIIAALVLAVGCSAFYKTYRFLLNYSLFVWMLHFLTIAPYLYTLYDSYKNNDSFVTDNWVSIGGISFQPSELAKFLYVFSLSTILNHPKYSEKKKLTMSIGLSAVCAALLILQGEFGSIIIMIAVWLLICLTYINRTFYLLRVLAVLIAICLVMGAMVYGYTRIADNALSDFLSRQLQKIVTRFTIWQHFDEDRENTGYQLYQGLRAMKTGGLWGTGPNRFVKVPVADSDMIFPMIVQTYGMVFGIGIIGLYLAYAICCLKIAIETHDYLNRGIVFGLITTIFLQCAFQIAGSTTVFLLSGNTLPFLSRGSTSLLICSLMSAVIFKVHQYNKKRISEEKKSNVIEETSQPDL